MDQTVKVRYMVKASSLTMNWLQIRSIGPDVISFVAHSYGYEPSTELKSVLNRPYFRFSPEIRQAATQANEEGNGQ